MAHSGSRAAASSSGADLAQAQTWRSRQEGSSAAAGTSSFPCPTACTAHHGTGAAAASSSGADVSRPTIGRSGQDSSRAAASTSLPGFSMQDNPYATITGLLVMKRSMLVDLRRTSDSSAERVRREGPQRSHHPASPSRSSSSSTLGSVVSCSSFGEGEAAAARAPCEEESDEDVQDVTVPASRQKQVYNLCKNKRLRLRAFEAKVKEAILENPSLHMDEIQFPAFVAHTPKLVDMLSNRFLGFRQSVLAGENPDPHFRHPPNQANARQRNKQENIVWL